MSEYKLRSNRLEEVPGGQRSSGAGLRISVVTATWNSAATLADTLNSVNSQHHDDVEHIIVDGGSTDNTLTLVSELGHRVKRIVSGPDEGIYDAMNKGISLATGDVVGLLNSDDFYSSAEALNFVAEAFEDPAVDMVYADLCYVAQEDVSRIVRYWRSGPFRKGLFALAWAPPHPTVFVRRHFFAQLGGFDLAFPVAADLELMARYLEVHGLRSRHIARVLVHMRTGGASNRSAWSVAKQHFEVSRALRKNGLFPSAFRFLAGKALSRSRQLLLRPR